MKKSLNRQLSDRVFCPSYRTYVILTSCFSIVKLSFLVFSALKFTFLCQICRRFFRIFFTSDGPFLLSGQISGQISGQEKIPETRINTGVSGDVKFPDRGLKWSDKWSNKDFKGSKGKNAAEKARKIKGSQTPCRLTVC